MGYFSFRKLITPPFVKTIYFVGLLAITVAGVGLTGWAAWRLSEATISRELGWRYVLLGIGSIVLGNLVWRVFCEIWIVIFNLHNELVAVRQALATNYNRPETVPEITKATSDLDDRYQAGEYTEEEHHRLHRPAGVLGLS